MNWFTCLGQVIKRKRAGLIALMFFALSFGLGSHAAATPVLTFVEATGGSGFSQDQSVGWQFDVLEALEVTGLGWFDQGGDGLALAHMVGIWSPGGALLASLLVPAGVAAPLDGQFRTASLDAPLLLTPGAGYIVGGQNFLGNPERLACGGSVGSCMPALLQMVDPRIRYFDATFSGIGGFMRPTMFSSADTGFYGPSFSVGGVIPEPGTLLLLGTGVAGVVARLRKRARRER